MRKPICRDGQSSSKAEQGSPKCREEKSESDELATSWIARRDPSHQHLGQPLHLLPNTFSQSFFYIFIYLFIYK
jgi:hypothetical protein